jgi:hypothetical protein
LTQGGNKQKHTLVVIGNPKTVPDQPDAALLSSDPRPVDCSLASAIFCLFPQVENSVMACLSFLQCEYQQVGYIFRHLKTN